MRPLESETIEWDKKTDSLVITRAERVNIQGAKNINELKGQVTQQLRDTIRQIKELKTHAQELREMLDRLEGKPPTKGGS